MRSRDTHAPAQPAVPLVDLYELTMSESYLAEGVAQRSASFEVSCRNLPAGWGYLIAAGLAELLEQIETLRFDDELLAFLEASGLFGQALLQELAHFRFHGEVRAMPEGTVFFAGEPIIEITAPLLEAQLLETVVLNRVHFASLVAAKAARCVDAAEGRTLVDFSLRRTHGADASLQVARGSYLAGFDSTSNVAAGARFGIPVSGTMAHSYVSVFADESAAFEAFTRAYPEGSTLLVDTYDTLEGTRRAAAVARELAARGGRVSGVRLDSGDLLELSRDVRLILDSAGLPELSIIASGNLDEYAIARLLAAAAPIDGFGVGTRLGVSADAPALDLAYKLVSFDTRPVMKLSNGKRTSPGAKQVWRRSDGERFAGDLISLRDEAGPTGAVPLLQRVMANGTALIAESLETARVRAAAERAALDPGQRMLDATAYPVERSRALVELDARLAGELERQSSGSKR